MGLKIALVGTGSVARNNYLPFLAKQEDVSLLYFNRTRAKADECARGFGGEVLDSPRELVAAQPDAIFVLTRETQRYEATSILLEHHPKRLFFEKPLVAKAGQEHVTEEDFFRAKELLGRAKAAGTETAMIFNYRFFDQTKRAQALIGERDFGKPIETTALVHFACWSHCIDLIHVFAGSVAKMSAVGGEVEHGSASDVAAAFRLENEAVGTILGTQGMSFEFPLFELTLNFEKGRIHLRGLDGEMEVLDYGSKVHESYGLIRNYSRWDQYNASFEKSVGAYLDSIRKNLPPPVPGIAGLRELQFEAALRRAIKEHRTVEVQEEFPLEL